MSSSWTTLGHTLCRLDAEIRCSKPAERAKALERLTALLDTRADELVQLFKGVHCTPPDTVGWLQLVDSAHEACAQQAGRLESVHGTKSQSAAEAKNRDHIAVLQKLVALANRDGVRNVSCSAVLNKVFRCLADGWMVRYFGNGYLQMLHEHVLHGNEDDDDEEEAADDGGDVSSRGGYCRAGLEAIKVNEWSRLLSCCFQLFDNEHIQRLTLLQCFPPIIRYGCRYTYLAADLVQYLPSVEAMMLARLEVNATSELIRTMFAICSNIALDHRVTVCQHLETTLDAVINAYSARMSDRAKRTLFQLLHLAIAVHSPEGNVCAETASSCSAERDLWLRHMRNMFELLHTEIGQQQSEQTRLQTNPRLCAVFASLGAAVCSVVFWESAVWSSEERGTSSGETVDVEMCEPQRKRQKRPDRLQGVMNVVETQPGVYCWRWMCILANMLSAYPTCLRADDRGAVLRMLHAWQLTIRFPVEVETLCCIAVTLLKAEPAPVAGGPVEEARCDDFWYKIAQTAFRTTAASLLPANVELIRQLVLRKRCLPDGFLETMLRTFLSNAIPKSNATVRLVAAILRHNSVDALDRADVKEMRYAVMDWLHRRKIVTVRTERMEMPLVAELTALCLFTKIDASVVRTLDASEDVTERKKGKFTTFLQDLQRDMLFKSVRRLIVAERDIHQPVETNRRRRRRQRPPLPQADNLLAVINEQHFEHLFEILKPDREMPAQEDNLIAFYFVTDALLMYLHLLDQLIRYAALDQERLEKTFLAKKCLFKLEQLEMCVLRFRDQHDFSLKDSIDVLERLRTIFDGDLHPVLAEMVRSRALVNVVGWLQQRLELNSKRMRDSREVFLRSVGQLNDTNLVRYETFAALANVAEGASETLAFGVMAEFDFNLQNNTDVLIVLHLLRVLLRQTSTEAKAVWCFGQMKQFCVIFYQNQQLTEQIIDLIPELVAFIRHYATMTDDLVQLITSFLMLAKKRKYGPHITRKLIRSLVSIAIAYPAHLTSDEQFGAIFLVVERFLGEAHPLRVQYAAIETLSYVFDVVWLRGGSMHSDRTSDAGAIAMPLLRTFHRRLYASLSAAAEKSSAEASLPETNNTSGSSSSNVLSDIDRNSRTIGTRVQQLCAIAAVNPLLQNEAWFALIAFAEPLSAAYVNAVVQQLCDRVRIDRDLFVAENMRGLFTQWLRSGRPLERFPWHIQVGVESLAQFCRAHANALAQCLLHVRPADGLDEFVRLSGGTVSIRATLEPILGETLAYLLPYFANGRSSSSSSSDHMEMPESYASRATDISNALRTHVPNVAQCIQRDIVGIVGHLLSNAWDVQQFEKWFGFVSEDIEPAEHAVNEREFDKCLAYVQENGTAYRESTLLLNLCQNTPHCIHKLAQHLKLRLQRVRRADQQLQTLYQYAVLVQHIVEFMVREAPNTAADNAKCFFLRDIMAFLCNLLVQHNAPNQSPSALHAVLELLLIVCERLLPKRAALLRPHFNGIVATLLRIATASRVGAAPFAVLLRALRFLIVEQRTTFGAEIALLDNFPVHLGASFDELRRTHALIKFGGRHKEFTLREELECFLRISDRKTEGLVALREQMSSKKTELAAIFHQHRALIGQRDGGGIGEMEESNLHRLIVSLLRTVKNATELDGERVDAEEARSLEAAKCLGELGPSDLGTFVMQPDSQMHTYKFFATLESANKHFCRIVLGSLNELLLHNNVDIVEATSEALLFLLEHKIAQEVAQDGFAHLSVFFAVRNPREGLVFAMPAKGDLRLAELFAEHQRSEHAVWIRAVVNEIFAFFDDEKLRQVAAIHTPFAESVLPLLIQMLLTCPRGSVIEGLRQSVCSFFEMHSTCRTGVDDRDEANRRPLCLNSTSIKAMLNVTECIRMYNLFNVTKTIALNYLHIAAAAQFCEANFTAVLYADLWAYGQPFAKASATRAHPELQSLLRAAYTSIGERDAVHAFLDPIRNRRDYLSFNKSWSRIFLEQDVRLAKSSDQSPAHFQAMMASSQLAGLYGLSNCLAVADRSTSVEQYECAWRLSDWSILDQPADGATQQPTADHRFEAAHYKALQCLQIKDELGTRTAIKSARLQVIADLRSASLECTNSVYKHLLRLAQLQQIDDFVSVQFQQTSSNSNAGGAPATQPPPIMAKWRAQDRIAYSSFAAHESLLAQRIAILRSAGVRAARRLQTSDNLPPEVRQHALLLRVARTARHIGELDTSVRYVAQLSFASEASSCQQQLSQQQSAEASTVATAAAELSAQIRSGLLLEDAQLNWQLGDRRLADRLYRKALGSKDIGSSLSRARTLRIYGECLAEMQSSDTRSLIDQYFLGSLKLLAVIEKQRDALGPRMRMPPAAISAFVRVQQGRAFAAIGKYADREYGRLVAHMRSAQFVQKRESVAQNAQRVLEMGAARNASRDMKCTRTVLHRNTDIDRKEIAATEAEQDEYLQLATRYYMKAVAMMADGGATDRERPASCDGGGLEEEDADGEDDSSSSSSLIFRIVSLWLANRTQAALMRELRAQFANIASWQFMAVLPQVAVRLTNAADDFGETVMEIVERCAQDHPQQTIYQILALTNAYMDDSMVTEQSLQQPRMLGAKKLLDRLQRGSKTTLIVAQMSEMCKALIAYANKESTDNTRISSKEHIRRLLNLNYVHCPTLTLPVSKSAKYPNLITIQKWSDVLTMVGGINAPKKIECLCSDGRTYPQLIKAKDDLRQDAIMQQVFTILNEMLATNRDTQKARLSVKTYRVVPLTQRSGILEWCANTLPLAVYLAGTPKQAGAHERFHPGDLKPNYCRKVISSYNREQKPINDKMKIFKELCEQFRPALQYFFFERFAQPGDWFVRRLAYTKSVATTSMVGYILGIGDRHVSNILIDERTAELVHIDFGIAFEQSKCLPTPETVPFRLTRDMVAAIGVSGVDGIFRHTCERTMSVLRRHKRTIITILEVLLYDPLYAWTLSAEQAYSRQSSIGIGGGEQPAGGSNAAKPTAATAAGETKNVMAERALVRLEAKLNGMEEGTKSGATATVEAHVELLIAQATSVYNLCRLFEGWQAYL